jgi:hypothetical protein
MKIRGYRLEDVIGVILTIALIVIIPVLFALVLTKLI